MELGKTSVWSLLETEVVVYYQKNKGFIQIQITRAPVKLMW